MITSLLVAAQVFVNGQAVDATMIETNGTIYVPIDAIARALGVEVTIKKDAVDISNQAPPSPPAPASPAPPATGAPRAWIEPTPPPSFAAIRGKLTWAQGVFMSPSDRGALVWLVRAEEVAGLAREAGGTAEEPIPTRATGWPAKLKYPSSIADAEGRFGFDNVAPGSYLLILSSKRANGLAARDRQGKMRFKKVVVHPGEIVDASINFGVTAYKD